MKKHTIYNNYDLWETYPDEELKAMAIDCEWVDEDEEITDDMLYEWRNEQTNLDFETAMDELKSFFCNKNVGFFGNVGRWDGNHKAGKIGKFEEVFYAAIKDCDYINIYEENGKMFLECSHHDGTNFFEIKEITDKGMEYLDRWEYGTDNRTEEHAHTQIYKRYSHRPGFCKEVYGI